MTVGDTHAAMGDGEVCGTAVQAPMDIAVRLELRRDVAIAAPRFVVAAGELARTDGGGYLRSRILARLIAGTAPGDRTFALGEETDEPGRNIPRAIFLAPLTVGILTSWSSSARRSDSACDRFPWIVLGWLAVGAVIVAVAPGVTRRVGVALTRELGDPPGPATSGQARP